MIELKDFSIGFKGKELLSGVNTIFLEGQLTALLGRNGAGKSTLLKALCGLNPGYKGEILIDGQNIKDIKRSLLAKKISFVNTHRPSISNLKCLEIVELGRSPHTGWNGKISLKDSEIALNALKTVDMLNYADRNFNSLSDGECQKIMIARAVAQDTEIILMDEPTSFLDLPTRFELGNLLRQLTNDQHKLIIFSTHDLDISLLMSDRIAIIDDGSLINLPVNEMNESGIIQRLFASENENIITLLNRITSIKK